MIHISSISYQLDVKITMKQVIFSRGSKRNQQYSQHMHIYAGVMRPDKTLYIRGVCGKTFAETLKLMQKKDSVPRNKQRILSFPHFRIGYVIKDVHTVRAMLCSVVLWSVCPISFRVTSTALGQSSLNDFAIAPAATWRLLESRIHNNVNVTKSKQNKSQSCVIYCRSA